MPGPPTVETLRPLVALADAGKYKVTVTKRYPLSEAGAAWEHLSKSEGVGKTVLIVDAAKAGQR
jgi:NADPH:quinone reductase-like Zn-dependent oxidoreductase